MLYFCFAFWGNARVEMQHLEEVTCQNQTFFRTHKTAPVQCFVYTGNDDFNLAVWFANIAKETAITDKISPQIQQDKQKSWENYVITGFSKILVCNTQTGSNEQIGLLVEYNSLRVYLHNVMDIYDVTKAMLHKFYKNYHEKDTDRFTTVDQKQKALNLYNNIEHLEKVLLEQKAELDQKYPRDDKAPNKTQEELAACTSACQQYNDGVNKQFYLSFLLHQRFSYINTAQKKNIFQWFFKNDKVFDCPANLYGLSDADQQIFFEMINDDAVTDVRFYYIDNKVAIFNKICYFLEENPIPGVVGQRIQEDIIRVLKQKKNLKNIVFPDNYPIFVELEHLNDWASKDIRLHNVFFPQYDWASWQAFWDALTDKQRMQVSCWPIQNLWDDGGFDQNNGTDIPNYPTQEEQDPITTGDALSDQDNIITQEDLKVFGPDSDCSISSPLYDKILVGKLSNSKLSEEQVSIVEKILNSPQFDGIHNLTLVQQGNGYQKIVKALAKSGKKIGSDITLVSIPVGVGQKVQDLDDEMINILRNSQNISSLKLDGYAINDETMLKLSNALSGVGSDFFTLSMDPSSLTVKGLRCLIGLLKKYSRGQHEINGANFLISGVIKNYASKLNLNWADIVEEVKGNKELIEAVFEKEKRSVKISFKKVQKNGEPGLNTRDKIRGVLDVLKKIPSLEEVDFSGNDIGKAVYNLIRDDFWGNGSCKNLKKIIMKDNLRDCSVDFEKK